jgi:undecaprenyl-diphosphatase
VVRRLGGRTAGWREWAGSWTEWAGGLLAAFSCLLGLTVAAGKLLRTVERPDGSTRVDAAITSWVVAHRADSATTLAKVLSTIGSQTVLIPAVTVVAVLLARRRRFVQGGFLLGAWGGAIGLYSLGKFLVGRPRPPQELWLVKVAGTSFPSGHAAQSMATFLAFAIVASVFVSHRHWPGLALALVLTAGVGWSRVYLGVHWSTDVAAGWVMAAAWVVILSWFERRTEPVGRRPGVEGAAVDCAP